jgi:hypothetical protein
LRPAMRQLFGVKRPRRRGKVAQTAATKRRWHHGPEGFLGADAAEPKACRLARRSNRVGSGHYLGNREAGIDIGLEAGSRSSALIYTARLLGLIAFRHNLRRLTVVAGAELVSGTWFYDLSSKVEAAFGCNRVMHSGMRHWWLRSSSGAVATFIATNQQSRQFQNSRSEMSPVKTL